MAVPAPDPAARRLALRPRLPLAPHDHAAPVILAPMSGVTDRPFRRAVRRLGGGLVVSEMIASREVLRGAAGSVRCSEHASEEAPLIVQLAGHDPATMADAARLCVDRGAAAIDINFGCPVKKVVSKLAGSALMADEDLSERIMAAVARAVAVPVTVKMRLGYSRERLNAPEIARRARRAGVRLITVHGRTRCQMYSGSADWRAVAAVAAAAGVPVVVNGDITGAADIERALALSGADGVMIGRAATGRPWLIAQAIAHLEGRPPPPEPSAPAEAAILLQHYEETLTHYGAERGHRVFRKHVAAYGRGRDGAARFRRQATTAPDPGALRRLVADQFGLSQAAA